MTLVPGTHLGPYEILSPLGAGGMGEVYRARDTRLDRTVAIKVLPAHLADSPERRQRFEREAKAVSALSHAHICALYDIGHMGGVDFLVMEYVEGETLAARVEKGPLPLEQLLRVGVEVADALSKAHRGGVVHRDLKPANIMLTKSGVKLLDFGLAKLAPGGVGAGLAPPRATSAPGGSSLPEAPTKDKPLTTEGTLLGTLQYMAPEQLEGKDADARADIFSLGAVLYEMATGKRAFEGKSQASVIAAILEKDPPAITTLQPMTPPALERVIKKCLAKNPDERWQSAHDLMDELKWIAEGGAVAAVYDRREIGARRAPLHWLAWATTGLALLAATYFVIAYFLHVSGRPRVVRFFVPPPEQSTFYFFGRDAGPAVVSPDGGSVAFVAMTAQGKKLLFVRPLDSLAAYPLEGTDGASYPFWSHDSRSLGFFAEGKLKRIDAAGGLVQTLCDAPLGRGGSWNQDGVILFTPDIYVPIYRISATGGEVRPATRFEPGSDYSHRWPQFLPDGEHFIYLSFSTVLSPQRGYPIHLGSLNSNESKVLLQSAAGAVYAPPGYLLFLRERTLMAAPFNTTGMRISGEPFAVANQVQYYPNIASAVFSASNNGTLVYQTGGGPAISQLVWFDSSGRKLGTIGPPGDYEDPRISRQGDKVAVNRLDRTGGVTNIWMYSLSRETPTRLTFDPSFDHSPAWAPDGSRIVFDTNRNGPADIYQKALTGSGTEEPLLRSSQPKTPTDWSSDGRFILYQLQNARGKYELWILPIADDRKPFPFIRADSNAVGGQFSPDGRSVAYASDETGRWEVYVAGFPGPGGKWQISTAGGAQPRWRADGKQIFFLSADRKIMAAEIKQGKTFEAGVPRPLFEVRARYTGNAYDVTPDGRRFLVNTVLGTEASPPLIVVLNWTAELKR